MTKHLGMLLKNAHAARPAIMSGSLCCCMGQTKQCREWQSTMTMAQTALRLPVARSVIMPNRPKSASAASPGGVSTIRTAVCCVAASCA